MMADTELRLLQAIRLKGRLSKDAAATLVGSRSDDPLGVLGLVREDEAKSGRA